MTDKGHRYRDTVLPFSLQLPTGSLVTTQLAPAREVEETEERTAESPSKTEDNTSSSLQPRLLCKKGKKTAYLLKDMTVVKANPNISHLNGIRKAATENKV